MHSFSGSLPCTTGPHIPSLPLPFFATVHAWHKPTHAVLQQTPSTQLPDAHCAAIVHVPPFVMGITHAPIEHTNPPAHCAFVVHAPWQAPFEHA